MYEITRHIDNLAVREYFKDHISGVIDRCKKRTDKQLKEEEVVAFLLEDMFEMLLVLQAEGVCTNMGPWWVHPDNRPTKECFEKAVKYANLEETMNCGYWDLFHGTAVLFDYDEVMKKLLPEGDLSFDEIYGVE